MVVRLLNDFGEGFGMAQAMSYVDPQLLTYMALEERLAQAMEVGLLADTAEHFCQHLKD